MSLIDDTHLLYEAAARAELSSRPDAIVEKMKQLKLGLPAEDEFAAWCSWSGRCSLLHRLDQKQYPESSRLDFRVPDFIATFDVGGTAVTTLVEVKNRGDGKLRLGSAYHGRLTAYARRLGLPLIIALRNRFGMWAIFDIREMKEGPGGAFHADSLDVMKQTLSGVLLGDFYTGVMAGAGVTIRLRELERTDDTHSVVRVEDAGWSRADGSMVSVGGNFLPLLLASPEEVESTRDGDLITQRYFVPIDNMVPSYFMLPFALGLDEHTSWREILARGGFEGGMREVERAAAEGIGQGLVHHVMHIKPHDRPDFLPEPPSPTPRFVPSPA